MTDLKLHDVTRRFGPTTAIEDVTLSVEDGEFFTLVGPSGCGKTTTLRAIAGFENVTDGEVRFGDESMNGIPPEERDVGIVFQNYALFPHMSVAENVGYGLRFSEVPGDISTDERVEELLGLVDLSGFEDRSPEELSGGQRQRVALARALAPEPSVLLLDEPMSALDARLREQLRVQVKEIQSTLNITTVYVTHDQEEALSISDRVAVMNDGHVEQVGTPEEVYRKPASTFVASFVGDNNVFHNIEPVEPDTSPIQAQDPAIDTDQSSVDGGRVAVEAEGPVVRVGDSTFRVESPVNDADTLCIRPEDLYFVSGSDSIEPGGGSVSSKVNTLQVHVENVEFLGDAYRAHCDWDGRTVLVKSHDKPPTGDTVVGFDPADATVV